MILSQLVSFRAVHFVNIACIQIQYWCIDGKDRMYVARRRNGKKTSFSENLLRYKWGLHYLFIIIKLNNICFCKFCCRINTISVY
jgi:hypothetical protein